MNLEEMSIGELLGLSREVLVELRRREVIRTTNAPAGDYAEWLVGRATEGKLEPNSKSSWDLITPEGTRLQVKARVVVDPRNRGQRQLSPFRSWDFDAAVIVLFDDAFKVWKAASVPAGRLEANSRFAPHVNGNLVLATDQLLASGTDWTAKLGAAAGRQDD